jgi:hypothetical protein
VPGVPQPIKEKVSQAPWRRGSWSKSAEAHTPAMAIRRKIAVSIYFQAWKFSNTGMRTFFFTPSDEGFELVIGQHRAQEGAIAFVGEQEAGACDVDPTKLVDFLVGLKGARLG